MVMEIVSASSISILTWMFKRTVITLNCPKVSTGPKIDQQVNCTENERTPIGTPYKKRGYVPPVVEASEREERLLQGSLRKALAQTRHNKIDEGAQFERQPILPIIDHVYGVWRRLKVFEH